MNLSKFIKEKREQNFISINELARRVGVAPSVILRLENEETKNKSIDLIKSIFTVLNIDSKYISSFFDEGLAKNEKELFKVIDESSQKSCNACMSDYNVKSIGIGGDEEESIIVTLCESCRDRLIHVLAKI